MAPMHSSSSREEPASPFFLLTGDNPGIVLVTQPLTGDNYHIIIDPKLVLCMRCNNMVISWGSSEISASILYINTAYEIWNDLKGTILPQWQLSVSAYFTRLKALWDELINYKPIPACSCGARILLMEPLPPLNKCEISVLPVSSSENHAFAIKADNAYPTRSMSNNERPVCKHCGATSHVVEKCFELHGFPQGYKFKPRQQSMANQVVSDNTSSVASPISLTESQYQQLLALLQPSNSVSSSDVP
ncbi:hypothetical protein I3843_07G146200 [Carya illinoinensis]|nr:hypothetical protein I3843_07G146200 [Carya illinoinensis]